MVVAHQAAPVNLDSLTAGAGELVFSLLVGCRPKIDPELAPSCHAHESWKAKFEHPAVTRNKFLVRNMALQTFNDDLVAQ